jgi:hypothetical protein
MSFQSTIYIAMISDTSLNNMVNGGIYFDNLPTNFDLKKDWVVYNFKENERIDTLGGKNVLTIYSLYVKVVSTDTNYLMNITDRLNEYLTNYSNSNLLLINHITDSHQNGLIDDMDIYENIVEFNVTYKI